MDHQDMHDAPSHGRGHYKMLGLNLMISLAIMYVAMFAMIWRSSEFFNNVNMFYMALLMWAPMGAVMLLTMGKMYRDKRLNLALHLLFAALFVLSWIGIRQQLGVGDNQFLRSMIPHHSGAILMCQQADLADPEIKQLCGNIIKSQSDEIAQMEAILDRRQRR